jgi:glutathione S-transferase
MAQYTLVIGTASWSSWSLRPFLALTEAEVDFELVTIPLRHKGESKKAILKQSPSGKVPLLKITERGKTLKVWDSLAICETVAERHPKAELWPKDAAARATARAVSSEMHSGFPHVRDQLSLAFGQKLPLPDLREQTETEIARILAVWSGTLKASPKGKNGGPFLFGRFSIADAMYAPVVSRFDTFGVKVPRPVRTYMNQVLALPGMQAWGEMAAEERAKGLLKR